MASSSTSMIGRYILAESTVKGYFRKGTPRGFLDTLAGVNVYITRPANRKRDPPCSFDHVIFIFPEVSGHACNNTLLLADEFAAKDHLVVVVDILNDDVHRFNTRWDVINIRRWAERHTPKQVEPRIDAVVRKLQQRVGYKTIAGVGFSFGARYVLRYLKANHLTAGFVAHPGACTESDYSDIKCPLSIIFASRDTSLDMKSRQWIEQLLIASTAKYEIHVLSDVEHGFATRGDVAHPDVFAAKEKAVAQALEWFVRFSC